MNLISYKQSRSQQFEYFLSAIFSDVFKGQHQIFSLGEEQAFNRQLNWSYYSSANAEFSMALLKESESNDWELMLPDVLSWQGESFCRTRQFSLTVPPFQCLFGVSENGSASVVSPTILYFAGSGLDYFAGSKPIELLRNVPLFAKVKLKLPDIEFYEGESRKFSRVYLEVEGVRSLVADMRNSQEMVVCEESDRDKRIGLEVTLGGIEMSLEQVLGLRRGTSLRFERPESFSGYVKLAEGTIGKVEIRFIDSQVELLVTDIFI